MQDSSELITFYEKAYSQAPEQAERYARWRALGAIGKAEHVMVLCARANVAPASTLDVGCGDGALLCELHRRRFGGRLEGVEIAPAAVAIARARPEIDAVELYDGAHLGADDGAYELGILSHVLEHVADPAALLAEVARACRAVVVEVPLEDNWSARRRRARRLGAQAGHLQRLERRAVQAIVRQAGLELVAELDDALPLAVQRFFAAGTIAQGMASAKWALRATLHRASPALARRLFTVHYACLCRRRLVA